jgi:steroid delta-isomerase-like uncharacterized protein
MNEISNGDILRKTFDAFNTRDFESAAQWVAEDLLFVEMPTGREFHGREGLLREYAEWARAFPDGRVDIENMHEVGDWVITEFTVTGTNTGPFMGPDGEELPPSNKHVTVHSCDVVHLTNGQVDRGRSYFDLNTITNQMTD